MSSLEQQVVELLDEGWARWKIAEDLGLGESTVRGVIKRMCERYQCSQRDLPDRYFKENRHDRDQDDEEEQARDPQRGTEDPVEAGELDSQLSPAEEGEG